jgi:diguanylate cyclase (GGDEF)-like protein
MRSRAWAFPTRPLPLRLHIGVCVVAAVVLPLAATVLHPHAVQAGQVLTASALIALSVMNVEFGRVLDGGLKESHRPHKALSAWAFAAALLLSPWWILVVVATTYAHARWRGIRLQPWKWVGSAAYVTLAAVAAHLTSDAFGAPLVGPVAEGPTELVAIVAAVAVFLLVETVLFHGSAYLNDPGDEEWLRQTLRSPRFYATEAGMLCVGGLTAAVWADNPWLLPLLFPVYLLAQQAALHAPLQEQAKTDTKTGLFRYESWRAVAVAEHDRCVARQRPWSVVFADLDRFKPYNDTHGHLAGDVALAAVGALLRGHLRSRDIVGRFGGEEFCLFLPDTSATESAQVAERLRAAVESLTLPDTDDHITMSIGVASADGTVEATLLAAIQTADKALYRAKERGRNAVQVLRLDGSESDQRAAGSSPSHGVHPRTPAA